MGYDSDDHRAMLRANNNIPVIPGRQNRKIPIDYDKKLYALRRRIEMFFGRIKENRRWPSATRKPTFASSALSPVPSSRPSTFVNSA
jgi:hypothetical protein